MKLSVGSSWTAVSDFTLHEGRWLDEYLSCQDLQFNRGGARTNALSMLNPVSMHFASGLVPLVLKAASAAGVSAVVVSSPSSPVSPDWGTDLAWLRDYQTRALESFAAHMRGLEKAPTGSGKSEIGIAVSRVFPVEWLFLVHRIDLVEQFADRYRLRTGEEPGRFAHGAWKRGTSNLTVSSFQSIAAADSAPAGRAELAKLRAAIGGLVIDETHAVAADAFFETVQSFENALYRLGLSGTPLDRDDKENLKTIGAIGPVIHKIPVDLLIARGVLSKPRIVMVECAQPVPVANGNWAGVYKEYVTGSVARNALIAEIALHARKPCLVFADQLTHVKTLTELMERLSMRVASAVGKDDIDARRRKLRGLVRGTNDVVVCTRIFQEGIDVPELKSVVNAAGGQSAVAAIQRLGRGMRTCADGDDTFEMWDVNDRGHKWLAKHARARFAAYKREGHDVELATSLQQLSFAAGSKTG